jgi:hypothetical protein
MATQVDPMLLLKFTVWRLSSSFSKSDVFFPYSLPSTSNGFLAKLYFENSEFRSKESVDLIQLIAVFLMFLKNNFEIS